MHDLPGAGGSAMGPRLARRALRLGNRLAQWGVAREFSRRYDADVADPVYLDALGIERDGRAFYVRSLWLPTLLAFRRARLGPDDVVADIGAGKGAAVLLAASLPVRRVIGVELSERLAESARANVERNRGRIRAGRVDVVAADALTWPIPDDLTVVYLYCPFWGELFHAVLRRLFEAHERHARPLRIVYNYPWEHNWLLSTGRVRVLDVGPATWPWRPGWWTQPEVIVTYGVGNCGFPAHGGLRAPAAARARWSRPNDTTFSLDRPGHASITSR
jgi:SAM-dependent methyltransferase